MNARSRVHPKPSGLESEPILQAADSLLAQCQGADGRIPIPVPIKLLASKMGVAKIVPRPMSIAGRLLSVNNSFVIELNKDDHQFRQNFTTAHEVAHVLVARYEKSSEPSPGGSLFRCDQGTRVERLCDHIAGRLLIPEAELIAELHRIPTEGLPGIARRFEVSWSALAMRLAEVTDRYAIIIWKLGIRRGSPQKTWRVHRVFKPDGWFIPTKKPCPPDCVVERCAREQSGISDRLEFDHGTLRGAFDVHVQPIVISSNTAESGLLMIVDLNSNPNATSNRAKA